MYSLRYAVRNLDINMVGAAEALRYVKKNDGTAEFEVCFAEDDAVAMELTTKMNNIVFQALEIAMKEKNADYVKTSPSHDVSDCMVEHLCVVNWPQSVDRRIYAAGSDPERTLTGSELRRLMFSSGFYVGNTHMLPLLAGAGMARNGKYLFCSSMYRDSVLEKITNGLVCLKDGEDGEKNTEFDLSEESTLSVAKTAAYIGLGDSSGTSIDELSRIWDLTCKDKPNPAAKIEINTDTVVVVPDAYGPIRAGGYTHKIENDNDDNGQVKLLEIDKDEEANLSDGYGFIDPEWADAINKLRNNRRKDGFDHKAFIIRMPFVKGVLVSCDFRRWLSSHKLICGDSKGEKHIDEIIDLYGRHVKLDGVRMILTASMFKAWKQYGDKAKAEKTGEKEDAWKIWCDNFAKYGISPVIVGSDTQPHINGRLNYQFISSLQGKSADVDNFIALDLADQKKMLELLDKNSETWDDADKTEYARKVAEYIRNTGSEDELLDVESVEILLDEILKAGESDDETVQQQYDEAADSQQENKPAELQKEEKSGWDDDSYAGLLAGLIEKKPEVAFTRLAKEELCTTLIHTVTDAAQGRVLVRSESRLLCGDPFALLNSIAEPLQRNKETGQQEPMRKCLTEDEKRLPIAKEGYAYAPGVEDDEYVVMRNPQVSLFEVVVSKNLRITNNASPHKKKYAEYFGKHVGILFVPAANACSMGGADFDGDRVRIVNDRNIVDLAKRNRETVLELLRGSKDENFKIEDGGELPFVSIKPFTTQNISVKEVNADYWGKTLESHEKAISNRVGEMSLEAATLAFNYGMLFDSTANATDEQKAALLDLMRILCRQATCIGLEIDSAKSGMPPTKFDMGTKGQRCPLLKFSRYVKKNEGKARKPLDLYLEAMNKALKESSGQGEAGSDAEGNNVAAAGSRASLLTGLPSGRELLTKMDLRKHEELLRKWEPLDRNDTERAIEEQKNGMSFTQVICKGLVVSKGSNLERAVKKAAELLKAAAGRSSALRSITLVSRRAERCTEDITSYLLARYTMREAFRFRKLIIESAKYDRENLNLTDDVELMRYAFIDDEQRKKLLGGVIFGNRNCEAGADRGFKYDASSIMLARDVQKWRKALKEREKAVCRLREEEAAPSTTGAKQNELRKIAKEYNESFWDMGRALLLEGKISEITFVLLFAKDCPEKKEGTENA